MRKKYLFLISSHIFVKPYEPWATSEKNIHKHNNPNLFFVYCSSSVQINIQKALVKEVSFRK